MVVKRIKKELIILKNKLKKREKNQRKKKNQNTFNNHKNKEIINKVKQSKIRSDEFSTKYKTILDDKNIEDKFEVTKYK